MARPENGIIESTMLGDGRGALTYMISIRDSRDNVQGAGGYNVTNLEHLGKHLQAMLAAVGVERG